MIPNATIPPRHQSKISIPTRRTAGPLLLAAKAGAVRLGQLAGRVIAPRKLLLAPLPLQAAVKGAARVVDKVVDKVAVKVAVKVVVKAVVKAAARVAARVAVKVEEQPPQPPPPQPPCSLALQLPITDQTKMTATMTTTKCDSGDRSSPGIPRLGCGHLRKILSARS